MAEQLDDGEFWLPSQFLTDDDILSDFKSEGFGSGFGFGSGSSSDLGSLTTETETSDDDDLLLSGLTRPTKMVTGLSGSPQSTLYGWELTQQGSSHDSPTGPVELPKKNADGSEDNNINATLDLLNKAAGEVAKMKLRTEKSSGTGFFDCSNSAKGLFCPPPMFTPPFYPPPQFRRFPPHMMWGPVQMPPPPSPQQRQIQNRGTKNTTINMSNKANSGSNNRPLGLPPSAWPPLPGQGKTQDQAQPQALPQPPKAQAMMAMYVAPQSMSVGTGVFLPRQVTVPIPEPKKKSDGNVHVNVMKTKNKGSQRRNTRPVKSNDDEIKLPSEWVY